MLNFDFLLRSVFFPMLVIEKIGFVVQTVINKPDMGHISQIWANFTCSMNIALFTI